MLYEVITMYKGKGAEKARPSVRANAKKTK